MTAYTMAVVLEDEYDEVVPRVRAALADQGFGVLTEIDVRATIKDKLDQEVPPQLILGACRPQLAQRALDAAPSLGALLPCNVVVRAITARRTAVESIDPDAMARLEDSPVVHQVAAEARERLRSALDTLLAGTAASSEEA